jgi:hypothetical protein
MAPPFGSTTGPLYSFGKIIVATPGTPVLLSQNVSTKTGFGTPTTGVLGLSTSGRPASMMVNQLIFKSYPTNAGFCYLCFAGTAAQPGSKAVPNSIILILGPGDFFNLALAVGASPFMPDNYVIDADTANNAMQISAVIP